MWLLILRGYSYYMCSINKNNESEKTPYSNDELDDMMSTLI